MAGISMEQRTLVAAPIGIDAGMRLAWRKLQSHSRMSGRRVREYHPAIVWGRTIIGPVIAPNVVGRPHMARHPDLPGIVQAMG